MVSTTSPRQPNKKDKDLKVQIVLHEHWEEHYGALDRGPGYWSTRKDKDPKGSFQLISAIKQQATEQNASITESPYRRQEQKLYYDMGATSSVGNLSTFRFRTGGSALAFLNSIEPLLLQWIKNMEGRSAYIEMGEQEIHITERKDIDKAIANLQAPKESLRKKKKKEN